MSLLDRLHVAAQVVQIGVDVWATVDERLAKRREAREGQEPSEDPTADLKRQVDG
jgi:hypothetical protein